MVAKPNASQIITQRQRVSLLIRKQPTDRAKDFNIILDNVSITEMSSNTEYAADMEAKQIAVLGHNLEGHNLEWTQPRRTQPRRTKPRIDTT